MYLSKLTIFCAIKFLLLVVIASVSMVALAPDEAQYWTWSQALDFGYYSKPPGISWQIFLTTKLFGSSELGVRIGAMLIGTALTFAIYFLAKAARLPERTALLSALVFALSPMGFYLSFAATTDGGAILFLTLALIPIMEALAAEREPNYLFVGVLVALGALFKWSVFFIWPLLLLGMCFFPSLRTKRVLWGIVLSLLAVMPSFYWNMTHEWATFKHVFTTLAKKKSSGNFFEYLGGQIALFSPLFFGALFYGVKEVKEKQLRFLLLFLMGAGVALFFSCFKKMQMNWALYFYPPLMLLIGVACAKRLSLFFIGGALSIIAILGSLLIPHFQAKALVPLSYKINPYRQNMGVRALTTFLEEVGYKAEEDFLFADKYQNSSLLSFYGAAQKRAYFFNLGGARKNQFSYWPQMKEREVGKRGYFVVIENKRVESMEWYTGEYLRRLAPYFGEVVCVGHKALFSVGDEGVKYALIFRCSDYLGSAPTDPHNF